MSMFQSVLSEDAKQVGADWQAFSHITESLAAPDAYTHHVGLCKVFMLLHYVAPRIAYIVGAVCAFSGRGASQWRGGGNEWSASAAAALLLLLLLILMHMNTYIYICKSTKLLVGDVVDLPINTHPHSVGVQHRSIHKPVLMALMPLRLRLIILTKFLYRLTRMHYMALRWDSVVSA